MDSKFWDSIYESKSEKEVSWYQEIPKRSLETISSLNLLKTAKIIDIGGGLSKFSECLYEQSFNDVTVLDISGTALSKLKETLNDKFPSHKIKTITSNIVDAKFSKRFDLWHDRAVFHFLTKADDQEKYIDLLLNSLNPGAYFLLSTFSKNGPNKCSGLEICQYDKEDLATKFSKLELLEFGVEDHHTPFGTVQNFSCCLFRKTNRY
jgi:SAM-dependent methyltransferase